MTIKRHEKSTGEIGNCNEEDLGNVRFTPFTLIELLVTLLVLGILMAIAIPLISGVREAANNSKCRSNLKQLHTAIIAYSTGNKERFPNLAGTTNLQSLIDGGHIDENTKLGICPGAGDKPKLPDSSYAGGSDLDGSKKLSSAGINSNTIVLEDAETTYQPGRTSSEWMGPSDRILMTRF